MAEKVNKESKHKKKDSHIAKERKIEQIVGEADEVKVEEIPLVDEDCSRGMKSTWLKLLIFYTFVMLHFWHFYFL